MLVQQRVREQILAGRLLGIIRMDAGGDPRDGHTVVTGQEFEVVERADRLAAVLGDGPREFVPLLDGHGIVFREPMQRGVEVALKVRRLEMFRLVRLLRRFRGEPGHEVAQHLVVLRGLEHHADEEAVRHAPLIPGIRPAVAHDQ